MFRRISAPVFIWVASPGEPIDPGWGVTPPVDPGWGGGIPAPIDPGYGIGIGLHPSHGLPGGPAYPSGGPIKPPAAPILPVDPDWDVPEGGHPWLPGHWVPVDPGYGKPPVFGFLPVDPGWGVGAPPSPDNDLPGHWVPIDPDYDKPAGPCGGTKPVKPVWVWIPHIDAGFGLRPQPK